jgi:ATP-dependent DNA ligase
MIDFKPQQAKGATLDQAAKACKDPILEAKLDGWRMLVIITAEGARFFSRTGKEYTGRVPRIEQELTRFPAGTILDGEIVDIDDQECTAVTNVFGKSVAQASDEEIAKLTYVAFDILEFDGNMTTHLTLRERHTFLRECYARLDVDPMYSVPTVWHDVSPDKYTEFVTSGYEGVMVKDASKPYAKGKRGYGWFKIKEMTSIDVVVMELPHNGKGQFEGQVGKMTVGQYVDGVLVERAKVNAPNNEERLDMTHNPEKYLGRVLELKHFGRLVEGLRHPTFVRWREDKTAEECGFDNG